MALRHFFDELVNIAVKCVFGSLETSILFLYLSVYDFQYVVFVQYWLKAMS